MSDDIDSLVRDLGVFPQHAGRFVESALKGTAHKMKESWQAEAKGPSGRHASAYPSQIDYDTQGSFPSFTAEIGPTPPGRTGRGNGHQGSLGILEEAPGGVAAAPQNVRPKVIQANEADFERGMDRATDDALRRAGL